MTTTGRFRIATLVCFMAVGLLASTALAAPRAQPESALPSGNRHPVHIRVLTAHFDASNRELKAAASRLETPAEMTAAFFLARTSGKSLTTVLRRREKGMTWFEIGAELKVAPVMNLAGNRVGNRRSHPAKLKTASKDREFELSVGARVTAAYFNTAPGLVLRALKQEQSLLDVQVVFFNLGRGVHPSVRTLQRPGPVLPAPADQTPATRLRGQSRPIRPTFD